jgi:GTPase
MPEGKIEKALLVAVKLPDVSEEDHIASLAELSRLVTTLGYTPVGTITQARSTLAPAAVLGEGKLEELAALTGGTGHVGTTAPKKKDKARLRREQAAGDLDSDNFAETDDDEGDEDGERESDIALIAVDHDLTPSQARNLERATGVQVLDRTGVIIEIFHRHAKSREARLQVEIARLTYTAPRLRESPSGKERQQGKGAGESALELDRRKIRDRIAELREELAAVMRDQDVRRSNRRDARRIALVGYTNAGKSSLMRALTGSQVYVENKLFATLDTTVRALVPEVKPRVLVSDTVGFIKKLPHDLVASFKSTLDEALEASHLLHVVDGSDPSWEAQLEVTREVLAEIGADAVPSTLVLNKRDRLTDEQREALRARFPDAWMVSAHDPADVTAIHDKIVNLLEEKYAEGTFTVPYDRQGLVSEMHESGRVLDTRYEEGGVLVTLRAPEATLTRFRALLPTSAASALPTAQRHRHIDGAGHPGLPHHAAPDATLQPWRERGGELNAGDAPRPAHRDGEHSIDAHVHARRNAASFLLETDICNRDDPTTERIVRSDEARRGAVRRRHFRGTLRGPRSGQLDERTHRTKVYPVARLAVGRRPHWAQGDPAGSLDEMFGPHPPTLHAGGDHRDRAAQEIDLGRVPALGHAKHRPVHCDARAVRRHDYPIFLGSRDDVGAHRTVLQINGQRAVVTNDAHRGPWLEHQRGKPRAFHGELGIGRGGQPDGVRGFLRAWVLRHAGGRRIRQGS